MSVFTRLTNYTVNATQKPLDQYAFRIKGDYLGPKFPSGCYAIFDPSVQAKRGDVVAVTTSLSSGSAEKAMLLIGRLVEDLPHQPESAPSFLRIEQAAGADISIPVEGLLSVHRCIGVQVNLDEGKEETRQ